MKEIYDARKNGGEEIQVQINEKNENANVVKAVEKENTKNIKSMWVNGLKLTIEGLNIVMRVIYFYFLSCENDYPLLWMSLGCVLFPIACAYLKMRFYHHINRGVIIAHNEIASLHTASDALFLLILCWIGLDSIEGGDNYSEFPLWFIYASIVVSIMNIVMSLIDNSKTFGKLQRIRRWSLPLKTAKDNFVAKEK